MNKSKSLINPYITQTYALKYIQICKIQSGDILVLKFQNKELKRQNKQLQQEIHRLKQSRFTKIIKYIKRKMTCCIKK